MTLPGLPDAIAVVRSWAPGPDGAIEAAWATGCNLGTAVAFQSLSVEAIERSGVPVFTLIEGPACSDALDALAVAIQ